MATGSAEHKAVVARGFSHGFRGRRWWRPLAPWAFAGFILFALSACQTTPMRPLVQPDTEVDIVPADHYSNTTFAALIEKYATADGELDYAAWSQSPADLAALEQHVRMLAVISPENHPEQFPHRAAERSYWINAYNALVIHAVLQYWPLDSVKDVKVSLGSFIIPGKGFFYDHEVVVGGEQTNLYDLEKKILRTQKDPRLHFALNCASSSCPVLRPWEWTEEQLDQAAVEFVNNEQNVAVRDEVLFLSKIFKWYKKDFGDDIHGYLHQYAHEPLAGKLLTAKNQDYPIKYLTYDWELNNTATPAHHETSTASGNANGNGDGSP